MLLKAYRFARAGFLAACRAASRRWGSAGGLLLADHYLDASPEVLWGIGLIMLGGAIIFAAQD